jgi:hypothetical protein
VSSSTASASQNSAVGAFRVVWALWIGLRLVYATGYLHVAVLGGRCSQGVLLVLLPVLQAIWIPAYVWRKEFRSPAEAMIRSAAAAVAIAGIGEAVFLKTAPSFGGFRSSWDSDRLQVDYVLTVLLFAGLSGGIALRILRWRVVQRQQRLQAIIRAADSRWSNYIRSAVHWIASATVVVWLIEWLRSRVFSSETAATLTDEILDLNDRLIGSFFTKGKEQVRTCFCRAG